MMPVTTDDLKFDELPANYKDVHELASTIDQDELQLVILS